MMLGAALRLMRVSFMDTQAVLLEINGTAEEAYERIADASLDQMAGFAPLADIVAASHLHAHIRMFMN
jgi:urease accessory protein